MTKFFSLLSLASVALLATTLFTSCEQKDKPSDAIAQVSATGIADPDFPATSIGVKLNLASIQSYVYQVQLGENQPTPDPAMMYAEAKEIIAAKDGELNTYIYGVEGDKTYTIHFAFKVLGENRYISHSISSKTPAYSRLINIISADHFEIKVHFNVPADQHYRYVIRDKADALEGDDLGKLLFGLRGKGPQTISYKDGEPNGFTDPETGEKYKALVKPGGAFVVLMAYCDADGKIKYTGGDNPIGAPQYASSNKPMENGYSEKLDEVTYTLVDPRAKTEVITAQPFEGKGSFGIDAMITELSSIFRITPPASAKKYGAVLMLVSDYDKQVAALTEYGVMEYIQRNMAPFTGEQQISNASPLEKGEKYRLVLIAQCDDEGLIQIRNIYDFEPKVSTKPAPKLEITELTDASDGPYQVRFNIKATNRDCYMAKYILNYVKDVEGMIGSGMTYDMLMLEYGQPMTEDQILEINSTNGLTLPFDTFEDMENRIIIAGFNEDEKYETFHADSRSAAEPAKPKVTSDLFTSLLGTWEVTAKYHYTDLVNPPVEDAKFYTTITAGPEIADPNFVEHNETYEIVLEYYRIQEEIKGTPEAEQRPNAIKALDVELQKYKTAQPKFANKYSSQNRLVLNGFEFKQNAPGLRYLSSWGLFCSTTYASYDVDQLFFDYGPKLFIEIYNGDVVTVETNRKFIAPFTYHEEHKVVGGFANNQAAYGQFPVTVVDQNTIVIKNETVVEGLKFPFAIINGGTNYSETIFDTDITLKRVQGEAGAVVGPKAKKAPYNFLTKVNANQAPKRTRLTMSGNPVKKELKTVEIPIFKGIGQ